MLLTLENRLQAALSAHISKRYGAQVEVVTELPRQPEHGDLATPVCFSLAKVLRKAPRQIAAELDRRCPDAEPEAFDLDVFIGEGACGELREMLGLAQVFDVTAMLDAAEKRMAVDFMDRLEDELDRRCP